MAGSEHDAEHSSKRRRVALLRREWQLSLYPQAAEAGGCLVVPAAGVSSGRRPDPERALSEAIRRARSKIRRYGVANRLNRFATLTYAGDGCHDPVQLRQDVAAFFKGLRPALGGRAFPYVWVPERLIRTPLSRELHRFLRLRMKPPSAPRLRRHGIRSPRAHSIGRIESLLLTWFATSGRDLPWRHTRDPYPILVSEVMLQQTQVERVVPRYLSWLERWPTVESLASTSTADVIREWQGLGYNRRALNLHRAAKLVAAGGWPGDLTDLPGVGQYTAAAIRCFAYGEEVLPVDVNVERIQRRTAVTFSPAAAQALMDLGATICVARLPHCDECPLAGECPSRGAREEPVRKQDPFEGSFRQRRAVTLRSIAESMRDLDQIDGEAVRSLERDGLVIVEEGVVALPP